MKNECRCPQCVLENNKGICDRKDCCNFQAELKVTTRIEEMVEHFFTTFGHIFPEDSKWTGQVDAVDAGWIRGYLESALTEAQQAGIDEALNVAHDIFGEEDEFWELMNRFNKALQDKK